MKRLLPLCVLAASVGLSGCHLFAKKDPAAPAKLSSHLATDVEKDFMTRWIDHRTAELAAQGTAPADARAQATTEFHVRYSYTGVAGGKPPAP